MTKKNAAKQVWMPEICYEEGTDDAVSHIPFIQVPKNEEMPKIIYISEYRETGEFEPGPRGEELPVTEMTLHQYVNIDRLKHELTSQELDRVRQVLGLLPFKQAYEMGKKITDKVRDNVKQI